MNMGEQTTQNDNTNLGFLNRAAQCDTYVHDMLFVSCLVTETQGQNLSVGHQTLGAGGNIN